MDTTQRMRIEHQVETAVLSAKQNEIDALSNEEWLLSTDERSELVRARVLECAVLYAEMYNVSPEAFKTQLKRSL